MQRRRLAIGIALAFLAGLVVWRFLYFDPGSVAESPPAVPVENPLPSQPILAEIPVVPEQLADVGFRNPLPMVADPPLRRSKQDPGEPDSGQFWVHVTTKDLAAVANVKVQILDRVSSDGWISLGSSDSPGRIKLAERAKAFTNSDGLAMVPMAGLQSGLVCVTGEGWGPSLAWTDTGRFSEYSTPELAWQMIVEPAASLVIVAERIEGVQVQCVPLFESWAPIAHHPKASIQDPFVVPLHWKERTDVLGQARFTQLPSEISIEVRAKFEKDPIAIPESPITLKPGEERVIVLQLAPPMTIRGVAATATDEAVGMLDLWILGNEGSESLSDKVLRTFEMHEVTWKPRAVRTDAAGRFSFVMRPGERIWLGPAPYDPDDPKPRYAPIAIAVRPISGSGDLGQLTVYPAGYLTGSVVDDEGAPIPSLRVSVHSLDGLPASSKTCGSNGLFQIGALAHGRYAVHCDGGRGFLPMEQRNIDFDAASPPIRLVVVRSR